MVNYDSKSEKLNQVILIIKGKHNIDILCLLFADLQLNAESKGIRFNQLKRTIGNISDKSLSNALKLLERHGLVIRKVYPQVPPCVEYYLSKQGEALMQILYQLNALGI